MRFLIVALLIVCFLSAARAVWTPHASSLMDWLTETQDVTKVKRNGRFNVPELRRAFIERASISLEAYLQEVVEDERILNHRFDASASEYPYFNFLPQYRASLVPGEKKPSSWEASCFKQNKGWAKQEADGSVTLTVLASEPSSPSCYDWYLLATTNGLEVQYIFSRGEHSFTWSPPEDATESESWDLQTKGVRFMEFINDPITTVSNALDTFELFTPLWTKPVLPSAGDRNVKFLEAYTDFKYPARDASENTILSEDQIQSGDFFGVIRMDGLDPMLGWGMGSTTGHTTAALWFEDGLYVTESTVLDSYWPTDGIQRTPYKQWVKQAREAGFNVVHIPLNEQARASFNETAAQEHFFNHEGLEYGYQVMFWGWIDTLKENYPCLPPDYSSNCMDWELIESLFAIIDRADPDLSNLFWNQALNHRLNTEGLNTAQIWQEAANQGMDSREVPTIVEQDEWLYKTTKYVHGNEGEMVEVEDRAMVCCVWVASLWKAAGVFDNIDQQMNAGEQTNVDDYMLTIFEDSYTQILGAYTLDLNAFQTREPFPHMGEQCGGMPPDYKEHANC